MKIVRLSFTRLAVALALFAALHSVAQESKPNPYESIAERNPFNLNPPPPPPDPNAAPPAPPPPLATVEVTGILDFRSSKRVLLEIVPGPGKQAIKPMLGEGERVETVEVVSIDVENGEVKINNGGTVTNLALKVSKPGGAAPGVPAVPAPGAIPFAKPAVNNAAVVPGQSSAIYGGTLENANMSARGSVTVAGGNPVAPMGASAYGANPTAYGGPGAYVPPHTPAVPQGVHSGLTPGINPLVSGSENTRSVPARPMRQTPQPPTQPQGTVDPAVQYINMAVQKQQAEARGKPFPPLPPIPGLDPNQ